MQKRTSSWGSVWKCGVASVLVVMSAVGWASGQDEEAASVLSEDTMYLWQKMYEANMISGDEFAHVKQTGSLPHEAVVTDSPVPPEQQLQWQQLAESKVISPDELAAILFEGAIPDMEDWEVKAFEELAPVYEPDRRKRLTYDIRRKHQRVELIRLAHKMKGVLEDRQERIRTHADRLGCSLEPGNDEEGIILHDIQDGRPSYWCLENVHAADTISADDLHVGPYNLDGAGVPIIMWDDYGVLTNHQEFASNRVVNIYYNSPYPHATAVAGTMIAQGVNSNAMGMAPGGKVYAAWFGYSPELLANQIAQKNSPLSNHSYGEAAGWRLMLCYLDYCWYRWYGDLDVSPTEDWKFGHYREPAQDVDHLVYTATYHLPVWSAGNDRGDAPPSQPYDHFVLVGYVWTETNLVHDADGGSYGYDSLPAQKVAKNGLVVGGVNDIVGGYNGPTSVTMSAYSSFGPTDDGRIKPDVVASGEALFTTDNGSTSDYQTLTGTSLAAPSVTGSLALLIQWHERIYGTNAPMLASTLKAITIHTAGECGDATGPDYKFGWGLVDVESAAQVITNNAVWDSLPHIKEVLLADGEVVEFDALASTNEPLKVTVVWTDPEHPTGQPLDQINPTNLMLINDLDLRVISSKGATNFPWVLDPQTPSNTATTADNFRIMLSRFSFPIQRMGGILLG